MKLKSINSIPEKAFSSYDLIKNISASIYWDTSDIIYFVMLLNVSY